MDSRLLLPRRCLDLLFLLLLVCCFSRTAAKDDSSSLLQCISCLNCKMFEVSSQSVECSREDTMCLKADLKSGEVERKCATQNYCHQAINVSAYTRVTCCGQPNCNAANQKSPFGSAFFVGVGLGLYAGK